MDVAATAAAAVPAFDREKFERDMIELCKSAEMNRGSVQTATWTAGDLRRLRDPVKRKGSASTAAATSVPPPTAAAAPTGKRSRAPPNPDGSIASVSVKKETK